MCIVHTYKRWKDGNLKKIDIIFLSKVMNVSNNKLTKNKKVLKNNATKVYYSGSNVTESGEKCDFFFK